VKPLAFLVSSVVVLGCSNLTEGAGGVVGLEISTPNLKTIEVGETLPLSAQALDINGNPVAADITWGASDPTLTVDQAGVITGVSPGTGRVQAFVGSLASSLVTFTVIARADTLVVTDSLFTVAPGVAASPPLVAKVQSLSDGPLPSRPVIYTVLSPADNSVQLPGGVLVDTLTTGTDGAVSTVTLTRLNAAQPATAIVEVRSFRTGGSIVPGSGQRFTVTFQ
jgi:Big-like domain-containing protein